jgi:hypothetical protein
LDLEIRNYRHEQEIQFSEFWKCAKTPSASLRTKALDCFRNILAANDFGNQRKAPNCALLAR